MFITIVGNEDFFRHHKPILEMRQPWLWDGKAAKVETLPGKHRVSFMPWSDHVLENLQLAPQHLVVLVEPASREAGLSSVRSLREDERTRKTAILCVNPKAEKGEEQAYLSVGADDFIGAFNPETFVPRVRALLRRRVLSEDIEDDGDEAGSGEGGGGVMARNQRSSGVKKPGEKSDRDGLLEEYYPIIEGRVYSYRYESAEWPQKSTATMRVKNVSSSGGKTTAVWEETNPDPPDPKEPWGARKWNAERSAEGVMEGDKDWSQWVIRTPLRVDTTWESGASKFTIRSLEKTVKVPAGVFKDCLAIGYEAEGIGGGTLYYAKGVGLVRASQWGEWVPYDYWLESVRQETPAALAETAAAACGPRRMCFPAKKEAA